MELEANFSFFQERPIKVLVQNLELVMKIYFMLLKHKT